jgi:hypothetical protein
MSHAAAVVIVAAALAACGGGSPGIVSMMSAGTARHAASWNLGTTQPTVTAVMLQPLTLTVSGSVGTLSLAVSASPAPWSSLDPISLTMAAVTLNANCTAPAGAPSPAPGFTPGCYLVADEGGVGPYLIQGPGTAANGALSFPAQTTMLNFNGGNTPYDFFLAYVTSIGQAPPPPTPSPVPTATIFYTPAPVQATATPCSTAKKKNHGHHEDCGDDD